MKSILFLLPLLGAFAAAEESKCQCPQVKCAADDAVKLCQCLNSAETLCKDRCPDYIPTYRPCPINPPTPTPTTKPPKCTCGPVYCPMIWPQSCYCQNNGKKTCYDKCGGPEPEYDTCPPLPTLTKTPKPTPSSTKPPTPSGTHAICGGGRANFLLCDEGYICIKEPGNPGCGPECDGYGICVKDKMCGGIAAFECEEPGQQCVDDPRDSCDPKNGGWDCGGLCVYEQYL